MGIRSALKQYSLQLSQKAMEKIFADEKRAQRVVEVMGKAQKAKKSIDSTQRALLHQLNFATRQDFKDIGKQLSALQKRVRSLDGKLGAL